MSCLVASPIEDDFEVVQQAHADAHNHNRNRPVVLIDIPDNLVTPSKGVINSQTRDGFRISKKDFSKITIKEVHYPQLQKFEKPPTLSTFSMIAGYGLLAFGFGLGVYALSTFSFWGSVIGTSCLATTGGFLWGRHKQYELAKKVDNNFGRLMDIYFGDRERQIGGQGDIEQVRELQQQQHSILHARNLPQPENLADDQAPQANAQPRSSHGNDKKLGGNADLQAVRELQQSIYNAINHPQQENLIDDQASQAEPQPRRSPRFKKPQA